MKLARIPSRRLLQGAVAILAVIPISTGLAGAAFGPAMVGAVHAPVDLDSHYRYLSGLLLAIGLAFWATIPNIERRTVEFRTLTFIVFTGGISRLVSLAAAGVPSPPMIAPFSMELVITPLLCLWQNAIREKNQER
jgi:uncharacterized membrane protein YfcA